MTMTANRLPLAFKLAYTAFMAVLIPVFAVGAALILLALAVRRVGRQAVPSG